MFMLYVMLTLELWFTEMEKVITMLRYIINENVEMCSLECAFCLWE